MHALPAQLFCAFRYFLDAPRNSPQTKSKPIPSGRLDCVTALYSSAINIQWTTTAPLQLQATAAPQLGRCTKRQMVLCSTYVIVTKQKQTVFATSYVDVLHRTDSILIQQHYSPYWFRVSVWDADSVHLQAEVTSMAGRTDKHTATMDECLG
jgi:hypothetical protein